MGKLNYVVIVGGDAEDFQKQLNFHADGGYRVVSAGHTHRFWAVMEKG